MPILAEIGGDGFNFSGFQKSFHEAWDFIVPNLAILALCLLTAMFVGRLEMESLRSKTIPIQIWLRSLSKFLEETGLFGSKLLPAIVAVALLVAALNLFQFARSIIGNLVPPRVVCSPANLYARLADDELLIRLFVKDGGLASEHNLYNEIFRWEERMHNDPKLDGAENLKHWDERSAEWARHGNDIKLLALVGITSFVLCRFHGKRSSLCRMLVLLLFFIFAFAFCLARELYAKEQRAHIVLGSLDRNLRDHDNEELRGLLRKRAGEFSSSSRWLTTEREAPLSLWWNLELIDTYFFKRLTWLLGMGDEARRKRPPLLKADELDWLKARFEEKESRSPNSDGIKTPEISPNPGSK